LLRLAPSFYKEQVTYIYFKSIAVTWKHAYVGTLDLLHRILYIKSANMIPLGSFWDFVWNLVSFNEVCFTWSQFNSFHCLFDCNSEISCQRVTLLSFDRT
jgi:hypothetical protein